MGASEGTFDFDLELKKRSSLATILDKNSYTFYWIPRLLALTVPADLASAEDDDSDRDYRLPDLHDDDDFGHGGSAPAGPGLLRAHESGQATGSVGLLYPGARGDRKSVV